MKVLIDSNVPFSFAHGGAQTQIEETAAQLGKLGVDVEFLRWWDAKQSADLIHYFGAHPYPDLIRLAQGKGMRFLTNNLFTATCNRGELAIKTQAMVTHTLRSLPLARNYLARPVWEAYLAADHHIVSLEAEKDVLNRIFGVPKERITCIPYGLSDTFLKAGHGDRSEPHLICTGTITERKRCLQLARLAHQAQVPVLFVGRPYSEADPYWQEFRRLIDDHFVKYLHHTSSPQEMATLLQRARGFVLMSKYENWCLSAHEAVACGLPVLLPDQKWSRERFGDQASYFVDRRRDDGRILREFYEKCPSLSAPSIHLYSWAEVGQLIKGVYAQVLGH